MDGGLTPEELEQAIALYKAQMAGANADEGNPEEEQNMDADDIVSAVRERKDRRDSEEEQMDAEEIIAEQESDIEALLNVIDELQAANDMSEADEDDAPDNADEDDVPGSGGSPDGENADEDDTGENTDDDDVGKPVNMDSVDRLVNRRLRDYLDVCRIADRLNLDGVENMSLRDARKKVVKAVNPKLNLDGKSDSYINAAYDIAKQNAVGRKKVNDQRRQMMGKDRNYDSMDYGVVSSAVAAREKMIARRENGGKN